FDPIWSFPKPLQKPHPPILMGGDGPRTFDRVVELCDGWIPIGQRVEDLTGKIAQLRQHAEAKGRDPRSISISVFGARAERAALAELAKAGVERAIVMLPPAGRDVVMPLLDRYASLMDTSR